MSNVRKKGKRQERQRKGLYASNDRQRERDIERPYTYIFDAHGSLARRQTLSIVIIEVREERTRVIKVSGVATIATCPGNSTHR